MPGSCEKSEGGREEGEGKEGVRPGLHAEAGSEAQHEGFDGHGDEARDSCGAMDTRFIDLGRLI